MTEGARDSLSPSKRLLDRFEPLFVIGRGGMGSVEVAAEHGVAGVRVVALKRLLPHVKDRRHVAMFLREARLAALLDHKNVVHALAYGEHDGELLFAMEYVEGETLASLLERRRSLPAPVCAHILAELCEGLHAAHELRDVGGAALGVVHRDVSPHNVMLSYEGEVKLLDFGVAKLQGVVQLTKTGEVKGKTAYMSPEQASGDPLDRRSDLYGVGAILFELLAGRRMWPGETDVDFLRQLALAEPPSLVDVAPTAPAELCELQRRLVAKDPAARPATALDVAKELRRLAGESPKRALTATLAAAFPGEAAAKRRRLDEALAVDSHEPDPKSSEPGGVIAPASPARAARASPWLYGLAGASLATLAVLSIAKRSPAPAPTAASASPAAHAAPSAAVAPAASAIAAPSAPPAQPSAATATAVHHRPQPAPLAPKLPVVAAPQASAAAHPPPIDVDPDPI